MGKKDFYKNNFDISNQILFLDKSSACISTYTYVKYS